MLDRANFGMHVTGRVDALTGVTHRAGKSEKGKEYSFYQQVLSVAASGTMVEVVYTSDTEPGGLMCNYKLDEVVRIKVEKPRIFNGKVSFDAVD